MLLLTVLFKGCLGLILNETLEDPFLIYKYYHVTANFGVELSDPAYDTTAALVAIEPINGCYSIENGADLEDAIVLVKRGGCNFFDKARNVFAYGGLGLVVGNNEGRDELLQMQRKGGGDDVDIPCVLISQQDFGLVFDVLNEQPSGSVLATISASWEYPYDNFWSTNRLTKIVTYLLIIVPSIWALMSIVRICSRICRHRRTINRRNRVLPDVLFTNDLLGDKKAGTQHISNNSCPICIENFEEQTKIKLLPCDHGFHKDCIGPWIADHSDSCPICRQTVLDKLELDQSDPCCSCTKSCWQSWRAQGAGYNQHLLSSESEHENDEEDALSQARTETENPNQPEDSSNVDGNDVSMIVENLEHVLYEPQRYLSADHVEPDDTEPLALKTTVS